MHHLVSYKEGLNSRFLPIVDSARTLVSTDFSVIIVVLRVKVYMCRDTSTSVFTLSLQWALIVAENIEILVPI